MFASQFTRNLQIGSSPVNRVSALPLAVALLLAGCGTPATAPAPQPQITQAAPAPAPTVIAAAPPVAAPAAPIVALPHQEAVLAAARDLFGKAQLAADQTFNLVIDPLVDGSTGQQSLATSGVEKQLLGLLKSDFPRFQVKPLNSANIAAAPLVSFDTEGRAAKLISFPRPINDAEATAYALLAFITVDPENALADGCASWLLTSRRSVCPLCESCERRWPSRQRWHFEANGCRTSSTGCEP